jgi:hypothetical protein
MPDNKALTWTFSGKVMGPDTARATLRKSLLLIIILKSVSPGPRVYVLGWLNRFGSIGALKARMM